METRFCSLNKIPLIYLYYSFILAFSDYQIKIKLDFESFKKLLKVRDIKLNRSFGIFLDGNIDLEIKSYFENELTLLLYSNINKNMNFSLEEIKKIPISFVLLGERKDVTIYLEDQNKRLHFKKAVYDSGTGTIPKFRKMGFSKLVINEIKDKLKKLKIDGFILEVLQDNKKAINLYLNASFSISRKFYCFNIEKEKLKQNIDLYLRENKESYESIINKIKIKKMKNIFWLKEKDIIKFCKTPISWQNNIKSIKNIFSKISLLALYYDKKLIGLSAIEKSNGDIKFFGVDNNKVKVDNNINLLDKNFIFLSILLDKLINESESKMISILNVDKNCSIYDFLNFIGFNNFINQYEMYIKI